MRRTCGGCTLCCKLLPVRELRKGAGEHCRHAVSHKGCRVYASTAMPSSCRLWQCAWLMNQDGEADDLRRPDRVGYCIDMMPDYVTVRNNDDGSSRTLGVVQVWVDHANAHRDPGLRRYLARRAERDGFAALIRFDNRAAFALFPPALCADGAWHEMHTDFDAERQHTPAEIAAALGEIRITMTDLCSEMRMNPGVAISCR